MINPSISQANALIGRSIGDRDRYCIESHIGKGGMGEVYQATDTRLGKGVAVKILKTSSIHGSTRAELEFKRRFERECAICAALKSENIVQVSDYGITDEGYPFYVMEYFEGQTLEKALKQETKLSVERTIDIMTQICAGLRSAHEGVTVRTSETKPDSLIKVIHRDLKPANIFLVPTLRGERVKIIDFGVAKIQSSHLENTDFTNFFLGTHHYAAPEQFNNRESIDERLDIYCLGIILYEMLAGVDPFGLKLLSRKVTGESWIKAHLFRPVQPLRSQAGCESLSPELEQIVMRCLEKDPDRRFSTVQALSQALESQQNTFEYCSISSELPKQSSANEHQSVNLIFNHVQTNKIFKSLKRIIVEALHIKKNISLFHLRRRKQVKELSTVSLSNSSVSTSVSSLVCSELIDKCQAELLLHIGPIAKLIIERTLDDINYHKTHKFIEVLASHIPDPNAANHFRQTLLAKNVISS